MKKIQLTILFLTLSIISWAQTPTYKWVSGSQDLRTESKFQTTEPGARFGHFTFTDDNGDLWMFGGKGLDFFGLDGFYSDTWKYDKNSQTWNWVAGPQTVDRPLPPESNPSIGLAGNNSLSFDGVDDYILFSESPIDYPPFDNFGYNQTIELWIKPTEDGPIIGWGRDINQDNFAFSTDNLRFNAWIEIDNSGQEILISNGLFGVDILHIADGLDLFDDEWHHLALVTNKSEVVSGQGQVQLYLDGETLINEVSDLPGYFNDSESLTFYLGIKPDDEGFMYYSGLMDELRFWNVSRNQGEISTSRFDETLPNDGFNNRTGENYEQEGLESYFNFNEDLANETNNRTTSLFNTILNSPAFGQLKNFSRPVIFIGEMAEVRIWDSEKTDQEIADLAITTVNGAETGLVAAYNFSGGTPNGDNTAITSLEDLTTNNRDGNFVNFDLNGVESNFRSSRLPVLPNSYPNTDGDGNALGFADMNDDGFNDIISSFSEDQSISILLNDQTGNFSAPTSFDVGSIPQGLTVGFYNNDAFPDVAVSAWGANPSDERVRVFFGDGTGGFSSTTDITTLIGTEPDKIQAADLNGDAIEDLVIGNELYLAIKFGVGDGTFSPAGEYDLGDPINEFSIDDFTNNGLLDIASTTYTFEEGQGIRRTLRTLVNDGNGSFSIVESSQSTSFDFFNLGNSIRSIDLNNDGNQDLISHEGAFLAGLGNGDGSFEYVDINTFNAGGPSVVISNMIVADMNEDGVDDIIALGSFSSGSNADQLLIYHGTSDVGLTYSTSINIPLDATDVKIGELNNGGELDIVISHSTETTVVLRESTDFQRLATVGTMRFDGDNDRIEMPDVRNWNSDFTWEAWIKTEDDGPLFSFSPTDDLNATFGSFFSYIEDGEIGIRMYDFNAFISTDAPSIRDNQWHHIAITISQPADIKFYVDGIQQNGGFANGITNDGTDYSGVFFDTSDPSRVSRLGYTNYDYPEELGRGPAIQSSLTLPQQSNWAEGFPILENKPGRGFGASWTDASGNLNIFGGQGFNGFFNSIQQFDPSTKEWITIKGNNMANSIGVYGTAGVSDPGNIPPPRRSMGGTIDLDGNFWMMGGSASEGVGGGMNDLWKYDPITNEWVWISGSQIANDDPVYGTKGISDSSNKPGAREDHSMWSDDDGNLWLYGGYGVDSQNTLGYLNDLWKYNITSGEWTWVSGSNIADQKGIVGNLGEYATGNQPGGRSGYIQWTDSNGIFWFFNGWGFDKFGLSAQYLNDLWSFDPETEEWAWQSGSDFANSTGSYNEKGLSSTEYVPGARWRSNGWVDEEDNLWMYGGNFPNQLSTGNYSDFWKYEIATNEWTWLSGYNATVNPDQLGLYGAFDNGVTPIPGARQGALRWTDQDGNFWMQGGSINLNSNFGFLNDLWKYDTEKEFWEYLGGSTELEFNDGEYGSKGIGNASNEPRNRWHSTSWTGEDGKLWFFGGIHHNKAINSVGWLNDLWFYDPEEAVYTWMGGSPEINGAGIYGQKGQSSTAHIPTARSSSAYWSDYEGNFYLFGGYSNFQYNNDIWKFNSNTLEWTWLSGNNFQNTPGSYGEKGVSSSSNVIGARRYMNAMRDQDGMIWVFGGEGYDSEAQRGYLNDLWKYNPITNEWTWVTGDGSINKPGNYGTKGVASPTNQPPSMNGYESWIDDAGNLWLLGGRGVIQIDEDLFLQFFNDLWKFDTKTNLWTWVDGTAGAGDTISEFGTQGEFNESNVIGSRWRMQGFGTYDKGLWLFGGISDTGSDTYNDFWEIKFTPGLSRIEAPSVIEQKSFSFSYDEAWSKSFQIQVSETNDFSSILYDQKLADKEITILSLAPGTNYYYRVNAINEIGESGFTEAKSILTLPATPTFTSLEAAISDLTATSVNIDWEVTAGILDGYYIDISQDPTFTDPEKVHEDFDAKSIAVSQRQEVLNLIPGTRYYARLQSFNSSGNSPYSQVVPFLTKPATVVYPNEEVTEIAQNSALVNWESVAGVVDNYQIIVSTVDDGFVDETQYLTDYSKRSLNVDRNSILVQGLQPGTSYFAVVSAINASGESEQPLKITILTAPSSPVFDVENAILDITQTAVTFEWDAPSGSFDGYQLEVSVDQSFVNTNLMLEGYGRNNSPFELSQDALTTTVDGLIPGQTYYARIRAYNGTNIFSPNSNALSFTTIPKAPIFADPSNVSQVSASLSWSSPQGAQAFFLDVNSSEDFDATTAVFENFPTAVSFEVLSGLTPGTTYYVRAESANASGSSGSIDPPDYGETSFLTRPMTPEFNSSKALTDISQTSVTLNWEQVPEVLDGYHLDISTSSNFTQGSYLAGWENESIAKEMTSAEIVSLTPGTQYFARLRSYNATGNSQYSTVLSMLTLPETPVFDSSPVSSVDQSTATLSWNAIAEIFSGYYMELSTDETFIDNNQLLDGYGADNITKVIEKGQNTEFIDELEAGVKYYARIASYNSSGASPWTNPIPVLTTPATPIINEVGTIGQTTANVSWNAIVGAENYVIDVSQNFFQTLIPAYNATITDDASINLVDLNPGEQHQVRVRSKNNSGESPNSVFVEFLTAPATPRARDATNSSSRVFTANWDPSAGADYYLLEVSSDDFQSLFYEQQFSSSNPIKIENLVAGATYKYRVKAGNTSGESAYSNEVTVVAQNTSQSLSISSLDYNERFGETTSSVIINAKFSGGVGEPVVMIRHREILSTDWSAYLDMTEISPTEFEFTILPNMLDDLGVVFEVLADDGVSLVESKENRIKRVFTETGSEPLPPIELGEWSIISIPYVLDDNLVNSIFNELGDLAYKKRWRLMTYIDGDYQDQGVGFTRIELGKGYWFNSLNDVSISVGAGETNSTVPFEMALEQGWNQIGNPYNVTLDWDEVLDENNSSIAVGRLVAYNSEDKEFEETGSIEPFAGAFVFADEAVVLSVSPLAGSSVNARQESTDFLSDFNGKNWMKTINLNWSGKTKEIAAVGMHSAASNSKDRFDKLVVPRFENYLEMYTSDNDYFYSKFSHDIKPNSQEHIWVYNLASNTHSGLAELAWDPQQVESGGTLWLVDEETGKIIEMTNQDSYAFGMNTDHKFSIHYSEDPNYVVIPTTLNLGDLFPNPVSSKAYIPLMLPKHEKGYELKINLFDVNGRLVKTIAEGLYKPGIHQFELDIEAGSGLKDGIYFYSVSFKENDRSQQKKIIIKR